jgi:ankyrin repeat protein
VSALDDHFRDAVAAIDGGDVTALERLLVETPALARERLEEPGAWLRDVVGNALDGFFARPYLLWFVAEDPVRNGRLPANIADIARVIIDAARRDRAPNLEEQLDYCLALVSWSWIARESGVQIALVDVLVDAGANPAGNCENALVNGNVGAAKRLLERGAPITLATALCLGRWSDADRLIPAASPEQKQFAFVLSALNGQSDALRRLIDSGVDVNAPSADLFSHATPVHHAVASGSLDAVRVLVEGGADLTRKDSAWGGTPLGWAQHYLKAEDAGGKDYAAIADYILGTI